MPPVRKDLTKYAGSFEPEYWEFTDPVTKLPIDLTAAGYLASGVMSDRVDGSGNALLTLTDANFRRTANGRVYYEPPSTVTAAWTFRHAYYQFEITHPAGPGHDFRFAEGRLTVSPELT